MLSKLTNASAPRHPSCPAAARYTSCLGRRRVSPPNAACGRRVDQLRWDVPTIESEFSGTGTPDARGVTCWRLGYRPKNGLQGAERGAQRGGSFAMGGRGGEKAGRANEHQVAPKGIRARQRDADARGVCRMGWTDASQRGGPRRAAKHSRRLSATRNRPKAANRRGVSTSTKATGTSAGNVSPSEPPGGIRGP
jgi:hypothetical protein